MTGRLPGLLALAVVGSVAVGVVLLDGPGEPARVTPDPVASLAPDARTPEELARAACVRVRLAVQGIQAGSTAGTVRRELAAARALAAEALRGDGRFAALSGGVAVFDDAVRRDAPADADAGLRVTLEQCAGLAP